MNGGARWAVLASIVVAAIAIALMAGFAFTGDRTPDGNVTSPGNSTNGTGTVPRPMASALSTPSALPVMEKWAARYNMEAPGSVHVSYTDDVDDASIGAVHSNVSGFLAQHSADMAVMGRVPSGDSFSYANSTFLPVSPQAIAIVYNVPGFPDVPSGLKFDPATLSAVLRGNITRWDDPAIKELNPDLDIPGEAIAIVHEGEAGSASDLLMQYLNGTVQWPEGATPAGSADSLSALVRQTPYAIGYVDYAYATQTRMTYAALENSDGEFIMPSQDSIALSIQNGTAAQPLAANATGSMPPVMPVGQLGNGSYPIVGFYYAVYAGDQEAADFVQWVVTRGQEVLKDAQYPPLYEQTLQRSEATAAMVNSTKIKEEE
jgi:phosphate transport system substrate-binding protein